MKSEPLFDDFYSVHWQGMPEFIQEQKHEYCKLVVRFRNEDDLQDFAKLIGQKLNKKSQATWHPELKRGELQGNFVYVDVSDLHSIEGKMGEQTNSEVLGCDESRLQNRN